MRVTTTTVPRHHVNLSYITTAEKSHYILVQDLSRLVLNQYNNHKHKKIISVNIVCTAAPEKRYWKTTWKDASYTGCKESSSQKLTTERGLIKLNLQKQNTNYVCLLSSMWILTRVSYRHQNPSPPNISITYHVRTASSWNVLMGDTLNHPKWILGMTLLKSFWTKS